MGQLASILRNGDLVFFDDQSLAAGETVVAAEETIWRELDAFQARVMCGFLNPTKRRIKINM